MIEVHNLRKLDGDLVAVTAAASLPSWVRLWPARAQRGRQVHQDRWCLGPARAEGWVQVMGHDVCASPASPRAKWLARMSMGIVQIGVGAGIATLLFRMDWGASAPMVG
jgi:hypothetical protein